jgi:hypothetical protein
MDIGERTGSRHWHLHIPGRSGCRGEKFVRRSCLWLIGGPTAMLELVRLVLATLVSTIRSRQRLVVENLLLRQQLQGRPLLPA